MGSVEGEREGMVDGEAGRGSREGMRKGKRGKEGERGERGLRKKKIPKRS